MADNPTPEELAALDRIATGDASLKEARQLLRRYVRYSTDQLGEYVYATMRQVTFRAIASHADLADAAEWHELAKHIGGLFRIRERQDLAERFRVLADLIGQSVRLASNHAVEHVARRRHVAEILRTLADAGGRGSRGDVAKATGLGTANLSRIISNLVISGLIARRQHGRSVELELTPRARTLFPATATKANILESPYLVAVWKQDGSLEGESASFKKLIASQGGSIIGELSRWRSLVKGSTTPGRFEGAAEIKLPNGRYYLVEEKAAADKSIWTTLMDVTRYRATLVATLGQAPKAASIREAAARQAITDLSRSRDLMRDSYERVLMEAERPPESIDLKAYFHTLEKDAGKALVVDQGYNALPVVQAAPAVPNLLGDMVRRLAKLNSAEAICRMSAHVSKKQLFVELLIPTLLEFANIKRAQPAPIVKELGLSLLKFAVEMAGGQFTAKQAPDDHHAASVGVVLPVTMEPHRK
jgi:DNA-binding MarR family transcriptional regulator